MNHAVQLIGYDLTSGPVRYWIAKNQWGVSFGENGFVNMKYGENMCGKGFSIKLLLITLKG